MEEREEEEGKNVLTKPKTFTLNCFKNFQQKRLKHFLILVSSIVTLCAADLCLHYTDKKSNDLRVFSLLLRGLCQLILGVVLAAMSKSWPWKPFNKIPLLLVVLVISGAMVYCLDVASRSVHDSTLTTILLFIPILTSVFSITLIM